MVIYVTPVEKNGGILQFSVTMTENTLPYKDCRLFIPDSVDDDYLTRVSEKVVKYRKKKTVFKNDREIVTLAEKIITYKPELVVFLEDSLLMQQLNSLLAKQSILTAIVVHDVIQHPYRNLSKRQIVVEIMRRTWIRRTTANKENHIILLSKNSKKYFDMLYKRKKAETLVMRLGAHVPDAKLMRPNELTGFDNDFFLFFGRIDKYKGIANLCGAYEHLPKKFKDKYHLVIAGNGAFSEEELDYINGDNYHIHSISRFIEDGEMNWMFKHCKVVVLPYIEASQSGVLPISYHFSKPVIVSNQPGLTENVCDKKTGYIFHTQEELSGLMEKCVGDGYDAMVGNTIKFYQKHFDWQINIKTMLETIENG